MPPLVTLSYGPAECTLCPDAGGSLASWRISGQDMLRRTPESALAAADPLDFASFPLVPFSNRIAYGQFDWQEQKIAIDPDFPPEPHAIHGVGWKSPWSVSERSTTHCVLELSFHGDSRWQWPFRARQTIILSKNRLDIGLEAINLSNEAAPLAFGHHPYFDRQDAYLAFGADSVFLAGDNGLPAEKCTPCGALDFTHGERVEGRIVDNCYGGWNGEARIIWTDRPLGLVITADMPAAVVYIPKDGNAFCFEPVPHINNALNRPDDVPSMPVIEPGGSYHSAIAMHAVAAG
jgi:aldose 1-epimerase